MLSDFENYEDAVTGELLSLPELQLSLLSRDELHTRKLTSDDQDKLSNLDEHLLSRADEIKEFISGFGNPDKIFADRPPHLWWWHLARIASGAMQVDLNTRTVNYKGTEYSY